MNCQCQNGNDQIIRASFLFPVVSLFSGEVNLFQLFHAAASLAHGTFELFIKPALPAPVATNVSAIGRKGLLEGIEANGTR